MIKRIIIFNLISILSLLGQTGNLAGNINDSQTSQPLTGANISIESTILGAATDMDGQFVILDIPVGSYNISVEYVGYLKVLKNNVVIRSGKTAILNVEMVEDILEVTGIEVTANYFQIPKESVVSSESMDFEEIRRAPGSNMDIQRIVQALPSVVSGSDQLNEIITRGGNPGENLFMMDHIEIPNPNHFGMMGTGGGPINAINTLMVENVDFYAGAFSARYGDKASSVMNITLRDGNQENFSADLDLSMAGFGGILEGPILNGSGSYLLSARKSYLDLIISNTGLTAVPYYYNFQGKLVFDLNPANKLIINGFYGDDEIHIQDNKGQRGSRYAENVKSANQQFAFGSTLRTLWSNKLVSFLTLSAVGNNWEADLYKTETGASYIINNSTEKEYHLKMDFNWKPVKELNVDFGAGIKAPDFEHNLWVDSDTTFLYDMSGGNPDSIIGIYNIRPEYTQINSSEGLKYSGFVQLRTMLTARMEINAGLRFDYFDYNAFQAISPRFGVSQNITSTTKLNLGVGRHYQTPQYIQLTANTANKDLKDYYSDQIVFGIEQLFGKDTRTTLVPDTCLHYPFCG